jgi:nicotinate-nucleotide pyrophosphorylase (carboxylating)
MTFTLAETHACRHLAVLALEEDLGTHGDRTSQAVIPAAAQGAAAVVARQPGVLAGLPAAALVCALVDPTLSFQPLLADGQELSRGSRLALIRGNQRSLLAAERTLLNFLQRLCGIASLTRRHVDAVAGLRCRILDTRKTTPGWRLLEKYAVRCGGGCNHRIGLHDGILIKDNHLAALVGGADPVGEAVRLARAAHGKDIPLEIEVDTLEQLERALAAVPDIILLDNMSPEQMNRAVERRNAVAGGVLLEASGGVTLESLRRIGESGVDRISIGALTHSAVALDIGLDHEA